MNLYIDIGNSRLKWAQGEPSGWTVQSAPLAGHDPGDLFEILWSTQAPPARLLVSSVARSEWSETLRRWARNRWSCQAEFIQATASAGGVRNCYREPGRLGVDRWAALVGARRLVEGAAIVVDCGTAVTVDALSAGGEFLGGVIMAGLAMQREGLARGTAGIGAPEDRPAGCLARDTVSAVAAGTLYGLAGAIDRVIAEQQRALAVSPAILLTGGDAERLLPLLSVTARHVPDLVLRGVHALGEAAC